MASNSEKPLALYVIGMDAKQQYVLGKEDSKIIKAVAHTYVFDANSIAHCAELIPSYALHLVGIRPVFHDGAKLPGSPRMEQLNSLFSSKAEKLIQHFHCHVIDEKLKRAEDYRATARVLESWINTRQVVTDARNEFHEVIEFSKRIPCRRLTFMDHGELHRSQHTSRSRYLEAVLATMTATFTPYDTYTSW